MPTSAVQETQEPKPDPKLDRSRDLSKLTRHSYLAGLAGTFTLLGMGYLASKRAVFLAKGEVLPKGWGIGAGDFDQNLSLAFVLLVCSAVMFLVELGIRYDVNRDRMIKVAPSLTEKQYGRFVRQCLLVYVVELGLFSLGLGLYQILNEYGYQRSSGGGYYKPWFAVMGIFWRIYLYGGLPYVLLTRALQHDPRADRKQAAFTVMKAARHLWARVSPPRVARASRRVDDSDSDSDDVEEAGAEYRRAPPSTTARPLVPAFDRYDRSAILGLLVKFFFVPLMTVFFADQFTTLVKNYDFLRGDPHFALRDVDNVARAVIFSVDVGLAWCGYVVSSRWIKNTLFSVEPTVLGWLVALLSYPPINQNFGHYFSTPDEKAFFAITTPQVVSFFAICSLLSFFVYTSATVCFGLRFSNLTHRGIITTGPYALVRHPAYASKNFGWWFVMLPYVLYEVKTKDSAMPLVMALGLVMMSGIYYARALTEERHLAEDPEYRLYMKKVPYRFVPGLL